MLKRAVATDGSVHFSVDDSSLRLVALRPGVVLLTTVGKGCELLDSAAMEELEREMDRGGRLELFCDLRSQTRIAAGSRDTLVAWSERNRERFAMHVLLGSNLVEMALSVVAMQSGASIEVFDTEARFVAALQQRVAGLLELPTNTDPPPSVRRAG